MPDFSCGLGDIATDATCSDAGGLLTVFAADSTDIDWTTMEGGLYYDDATFSVIQWAMQGAGEFYEFSFERRNGRLDSTFTSADGFYTVELLNLLFKGHSATKTISLGQARNCCGLVGQVHDNNNLARVVGKEYISGAWIDPLTKLKVSRHLDTHGGFGAEDDTSRDELDLAAQHSHPPAYSTVTVTTMRTL